MSLFVLICVSFYVLMDPAYRHSWDTDVSKTCNKVRLYGCTLLSVTVESSFAYSMQWGES